jgi:signal transduction histidine kinase
VDNKGSGIKGAVIVHTDITERRNAEIERKRANALAGRLAVFASAAINYALVLFNVDGDIVEWSQGAQYLTHIHRKLALGRHFASLFTADSADAGHPQALLDQARLMGHVAMEAHIVRADRSTFVGAGTLYWLMEGNESAHYALILNDVTVAQRAEHALLRYQEELAGLARKLLLQEKETTQKLAQALHDELGQTLAALRLIFEARSKVLMQHEGMLPWVEKMERLINTANQQARQVLIDLRPPLLDELGLQAALDNELRQRRHNHEFIDFQMEWHTETPEVRWPGQVEYAAFIVAREAINNALLHAAPQTVTVLVQGDAEHLRMAVRDDGQGIANLASMESTGHLGLIGMRERAIAIGATLHIQSSPDNGTVIGLHWSPST